MVSIITYISIFFAPMLFFAAGFIPMFSRVFTYLINVNFNYYKCCISRYFIMKKIIIKQQQKKIASVKKVVTKKKRRDN